MHGLVEGAIMGVVKPFPFHVGRGNPGAKMLVERELISVGGECPMLAIRIENENKESEKL